jgi:hypothetical protein
MSTSRPLATSALVIPDLVASIFSGYCSGICVDFHSPACDGRKIIQGRSYLRRMPIHLINDSSRQSYLFRHRLKIDAMLSVFAAWRSARPTPAAKLSLRWGRLVPSFFLSN